MAWKHGRAAAMAAFALLVAAAAGLGLQSGSAGPSPNKPFTAAITPDCVGAGGTTSLTLTITNGSTNQSLGSMDVTAPAGFTSITSSDAVAAPESSATVLAFRNLAIAPKTSRDFTISATTSSSVSGTAAWTVQAKQSNDFNGPPGNDFTLTGGQPTTTFGCSLVWVVQPASAVHDQTITGQPYNATVDTTNPAVTVKVIDGQGNIVTGATGTISLSSVGSSTCGGFTGATNVALSAGVAAFSGLQSSVVAFDCSLKATSSAGYLPTPPSRSFNISLVGTLCTSSGCPQLSSSLDGNTQLTTSASGGSFAFMAFSPVTIDPVPAGCGNFSSLGVSAFDETDGYASGFGTKTFRYFVSKAAYAKKYSLTSGQQFIPICAGGQRVVNGQRIDCHSESPTDGWYGKALDLQGNFVDGLVQAQCAPDGMWWGILASFQDYNTKVGNKKVDWSTNPSVTGWGSTTNARYFDISVPAPWDWRAGT